MEDFESKMKQQAISISAGLEAMLAAFDLKIQQVRQLPERPANFDEMVAKADELREQLASVKSEFADFLDA